MNTQEGKILVELQSFLGSDADIANAAWTSTYDKDRREDKYDDPEKVKNIVARLIFDGHGVPIESVIFRFWIRMPIFTDRQFMTHRIQSANGLSGRYRTMPEDYFPMPEDVKSIIKKAFSRPEYLADSSHVTINDFDYICEQAYDWYKQEITDLKTAEQKGYITNSEFKRAREIFRGVLPTAGMVERTSIMNLRSFANFQKLRNSEHAQKEIQTVAKLMLEEVEKANICPVALSCLKEKGWVI